MTLNLEEFINRLLDFATKKSIDIRGDELVELIEMAKPVICRYKEDGALVNVSIPVNIVGDIHGQYDDLLRIFAAIGVPGTERYLFLGDYVDRGPNQTECIALLLAMRILAPDRVILLRGNHECELVNRTYGFWEELQRRFTIGLAMKLHKEFNVIFSHLPLAALIRSRILCMHGGLSPRLSSIDAIKRIRLPFTDPIPDTLEQDLLWSDPSTTTKGFEFNKLRDVSVSFGPDVVNKACKKMNLDLIVRAHQMMPNGYGFFANRKLVTVFSASRYVPELNNKGAVVRINSKLMISYMVMNPSTGGATGPEAFAQSFNQDATLGNSSKAL
ncbi:unnamed protein product [Bursaphelenchus okinawaensis]|uniref:Serine/threonine-protein phosphatase n=1 Tax=Bursaphelenchus okinawaensis TaxID=465554 RepID=A0A811LLU8_9BILA|nr:unnamed protein product [Bursaphelenchus okinawaensis]CAG9126692.1 unnamed protein product [Bursaphelenchus okinawaensis]